MGKTWRVIDSGPCSASYNMALDESLAISVRNGDSPPTLRLYAWKGTSLSLGCFQMADDVNIGYCTSQQIPVVRRPTGGRAILHHHELTYSFAVRTDRGLFSRGLFDSYQKISTALVSAFLQTGLRAELKREKESGRSRTKKPLCFQSHSFGEILIEKRKIVGSAQKRWRDGLLQQGSIPYLIPETEMRSIFGAEHTSALRNCTTGLKELKPDLDEERFKRCIMDSFEEIFGVRLLLSPPSREEDHLARDLEKRKYLQKSWNLRQ